jgi:hypothetical protein
MTITSDQNPHAACQASGGHGWEVSRLAGQALDRGTAMLLADTAPATCSRGTESGPASRAGLANPA